MEFLTGTGLVREHVQERRYLDYKLTVHYREDDDRLELLLDVASLANGGGGYVIIGVRDDGQGRAQRFEDPGDPAPIVRAVRDLCHQHIGERIDGLEVRERTVEGNRLVLVRIPVSARTPHMVTFRGGTHFWSRYEDGKRPMTVAEIREAFTEDLLNRRLIGIQQSVEELVKNQSSQRMANVAADIEAGRAFARLRVRVGRELSGSEIELFRRAIRDNPAFYLSATPEAPRPGLVNVDDGRVRELFRHAPGSRATGWIVTSRYADIERFDDGIRYRGHGLDVGRLELLENGHLEYGVLLGEPFYWKQTAEEWRRQPRLWPLAVIEYPLSFLRLYKGVCDAAGVRQATHVGMEYLNVRNHILPAGVPTQFGFLGLRPQPLERNELPAEIDVTPDFSPDRAVFELVRRVYAAFGHDVAQIPFWNSEAGRFELPPG